MSETNITTKISLPLLPLRDVVVFPHMVTPLFVARSESIKSLEQVMEGDKRVFLIAQKDANVDVPQENDLYQIGCVASVLQMMRTPDGTMKVLVEGLHRARAFKIIQDKGFNRAEIETISDTGKRDPAEERALMRSLLSQFEKLIEVNEKIPPELLTALNNVEDPSRLADNIAAHMTVKVVDRQKILESIDVQERLEIVHKLLSQELELAKIEQRVRSRLAEQVKKNQEKYLLSERIRAYQHELGELEEGAATQDEIKQLQNRIEKAGMPQEAKDKALSELNKLKNMPPMSAEATVCRNYLDTLLDVPWKERTKLSHDLEKAEEILEHDHYGLEEVKRRIVEYLAVQQRVHKLKGPILCLVGPPGVGKTSLGQSIANATGRKFARISLGGIRDEAEIRGHRRTYIGAMPGKIIQSMIKTKKRNPVFMLDEVDKMAMDFRGDPASALLEVLDPEQNHAFNDHYLEVDYDLSDVMFIATANSMNIPLPLLDRMEIIRLPGYTEQEKMNIAKKYLIPRQMKATGLQPNEILISDGAIILIIRNYTREAGVRGLEREIAKICRKVVKEIIAAKSKTTKIKHISQRNLGKYLGVKKYRYGLAEEKDQVGQVTGLAWTEFGGELLTIEAQTVPGKGKSIYTGRLGDIMQESIQAAMTVVRSRYDKLGIPEDYFQSHDFHIHVPEGATPKDGPSAGIGMCTALISSITHVPVRADIAMTGEITLRGEVLPIGGLKEKLLAALRGGIKKVIIPQENEKELKEIPHQVKQKLKIHSVRWIDQVLEAALAQPLPEVKNTAAKAISKKSKQVKSANEE